MRRFLAAVFMVMACATGAAADSIEEAKSAYDRGDYAMAAQLIRSLAEQGNARAQNNMGGLYTQGRGVPQDFVRAHMWFTVAATALSADEGKAAMKNRDHVASQMTAEQIGKAQEMARHCQQSKFKECD
ncbi:MAG: sel1 repeat family protein [Nitrospirota bacterium]